MKFFAGVGLEASKRQREEKMHKELADAQVVLQLAEKEIEIQELRNDNALIMLELAKIKGGM